MKSKPPLSDEETTLFREAMKGVKPLTSSPKIALEKPKPKLTYSKKQREANSTPSSPPSIYLSDHFTDEIFSESIISYMSPHLSIKHFKNLKKGEYALKGRLDLHGLRPIDAKNALLTFIDYQQEINERCVLIIHGKGGQDGQIPILKNLVFNWLKQHPSILAVHSALAKDGGTGAVYVLLRKRKN